MSSQELKCLLLILQASLSFDATSSLMHELQMINYRQRLLINA